MLSFAQAARIEAPEIDQVWLTLSCFGFLITCYIRALLNIFLPAKVLSRSFILQKSWLVEYVVWTNNILVQFVLFIELIVLKQSKVRNLVGEPFTIFDK